MRRALRIGFLLLLFSQPLIGVPLGIVVGVHAAEVCPVPQEIVQCITEEYETWTEKLSSLI